MSSGVISRNDSKQNDFFIPPAPKILLLLALAGLTQADADADALPAASAEPTATPNAKAEPTYYPPAGAYHYGTAASAHTPALTPYNNYQHYQVRKELWRDNNGASFYLSQWFFWRTAVS